MSAPSDSAALVANFFAGPMIAASSAIWTAAFSGPCGAAIERHRSTRKPDGGSAVHRPLVPPAINLDAADPVKEVKNSPTDCEASAGAEALSDVIAGLTADRDNSIGVTMSSGQIALAAAAAFCG